MTLTRMLSTSPGTTGRSQRICSTPGEPSPALPFSLIQSTSMRIDMAQVCQPLAQSTPNMDCLAASGSVWKGWGSYLLANSMISSAVTS